MNLDVLSHSIIQLVSLFGALAIVAAVIGPVFVALYLMLHDH